MKILTGIDVPFRPFGGSLLCTNDWYSNLPNDIEVRYLALPPPPGQAKWWAIKDVIFLDVIKQVGPAAFPAYTAALREAVQQQVEDFKPDIIHSQHLNYGLARVFADLDAAVPKIGICHGTDVQIATQIPFFADNLRHICDRMDKLVFPNQNMFDDFKAVYPGTADAVINPLGIPDRHYRPSVPAPTFDGKRPLRVLYAGRLLHWKGAAVAVEAIAESKHDVRLTVIGNEDEAGYKDGMLQFVDETGLHDRVTFEDQLDRGVLFQRFAEFDIVVFPSNGIEAFSLTLIEAQIHGLPVAAADSGGIVNTMGDAGLLVKDNTPCSWAALFDSLHDNPGQLLSLQRKGLANADKYRLSRSRDRIFEISRGLLGR